MNHNMVHENWKEAKSKTRAKLRGTTLSSSPKKGRTL
jgi:hypothetical protein